MRQPIKNSSRVPAYQNIKIIDGTLRLFFKPLPWSGQRGLGLRLRSALPLATEGTQETLLMKKGLGMMEDCRACPAKELIGLAKRKKLVGLPYKKLWHDICKRFGKIVKNNNQLCKKVTLGLQPINPTR